MSAKKPSLPGKGSQNPAPGSPAPSVSVPSKPTIPSPQSPPNEKPQIAQLIQSIEQIRQSRVIVYWLSGIAKISSGVVLPLYDQLSQIGKQPAIDLVLYTRGGDAEVPWRIVSLIREYCDRFGVLIPHLAHSAGTLVAMGADEIVMTPLSELGPIDPSRTHPLLPRREGADEAEPISVQDMRHAMQFIREAAGKGTQMPYTPEAMAQIFAALFEKIHPLAIGAIEQSYALAKLIGTQCLGTHMDPDIEGEKIRGLVDKLCDEYKSHAYQINRREARKIGLKAIDAMPQLEQAIIELYKVYVGRRVAPTQLPTQKGQVFTQHIAWLDSSSLFMRAEAQYQVGDASKVNVVGDAWKTY